VQTVRSSRRGSRDIEHIGSAHDDAELEVLKAVARRRLAAGQGELDMDLEPVLGDTGAGGDPLPITSSWMGHLWDALTHAYEVLGLYHAASRDEVFRQLVLARIIEPTSKLDSLRVLEEVDVDPPLYPTLTRRLRVFAADSWRQKLAKACARHAGLGPASLVLCDMSTLYFETDSGDGFGEPRFLEGTPRGAADHHRSVDRGQAQPVRAAVGRHQERQPTVGGQRSGGGRFEGLRDQLAACPDGTTTTAQFVIGAYHRLIEVANSFRMSKHDCGPGRPTTTSKIRSRRT
jgi:hypothetical protein